MATPKTVAFHTLGCKLNFTETSSLSDIFENAGYQVIDFENEANIYVINTCSVTDFADKKCRYTVRDALRKNPDANVIVVGCYAQLKPQEIAEIPGVDLVLGAAEKFRILEYIDQIDLAQNKGLVRAGEIKEVSTFSPSLSFGDRTRAFLKIQDGCNYKCSFCTIPLARGKSRSDTIENLVNSALQLEEKGIKEIVLTGVNVGDFGNGTEVIEGLAPKKEALLIDLLLALETQTNINRYRIGSIEPNLLTDEIIHFIAKSSKLVPHFHVPLQSGNNKQLSQMRRRYKRELYEAHVIKIKETIPHACIGADVILGFPGETDDDFLESYRFIESLDLAYLHAFTYSERLNTPASEYEDIVPMNTRRKRNEMIRVLSDRNKEAFYKKFLNSTREVLIEAGDADAEFMFGFTDNYCRVKIKNDARFYNTIQPLFLESIDDQLEINGFLVNL